VKKGDFTESQAIGLVGAVRLLGEAKWQLDEALSFVRAIDFISSTSVGTRTIRVVFHLLHQPEKYCEINVHLQEVELRPGSSRWRLVSAEGRSYVHKNEFICQFDEKGEVDYFYGDLPISPRAERG
jgi:hypothetical protein